MFLSFLLGKRILLDFLAFVLVPSPYCGHYCRRFPVLSHFVFVNKFPFL